MLERERRLESDKRGPPVLEASPPVYQMAPREFLRSVFPVVNVNVLELVYQGCGGSLERAVEQIASSQRTAQAQQQRAKMSGHAMPMAQHQKQPLSAFTSVVKPVCLTEPPPPPVYGRHGQFLGGQYPIYGVNPPNTFCNTTDLLAQRSAFHTNDTETAVTSGLLRTNSRTSEASSTASQPASHCLPGLDSSGSSSPARSDISVRASPPSARTTRTNSLITFSVESIIAK